MSLPTGAALTVLILAAGEGTRMRSASTPKVLHGVAGRSMLHHVLAAAGDTKPAVVGVVVGHRGDEVAAHLAEIAPDAVAILQPERNGTGHAVRVALDSLPANDAGIVLVLPGDVPLLHGHTLIQLLDCHARSGAAASLLTSQVADPTGYGRVIRDGELVARVVEHRDASPAELAVSEVAAGVYAFDETLLRESVTRLSTENSQGEQYLPDVVALLMGTGHPVRAVQAPAAETAGVNDRVQLAAAHRALNDRIVTEHMYSGVTVLDPQTTWIDADVVLAADVTLRPNVALYGRTSVAAGAVIGPDSTLTDTLVGVDSNLHRVVADRAEVGAGVTIGPFAYLRPGTVLHDGAHIGTYVEIKNSEIGRGSKVPHLSYVGDATIGDGTNIGAATVFVNYDGVAKHRSTIGDNARTGADNMFVAPVSVGDGAYTAAGSIITEDVPAGALGIARARQRNVEGWVARNREPEAAVPETAVPETAVPETAVPETAVPETTAPETKPEPSEPEEIT